MNEPTPAQPPQPADLNEPSAPMPDTTPPHEGADAVEPEDVDEGEKYDGGPIPGTSPSEDPGVDPAVDPVVE